MTGRRRSGWSCVLTDRRPRDAGGRSDRASSAGAVAGGVRWVVLREKDLPRAERAALAAALRAILADVGGTLVVAGPDPLGGDAVHLPAAGPYPPPTRRLVGRSCHDEAELDRLTTEALRHPLPDLPHRRQSPATAHPAAGRAGAAGPAQPGAGAGPRRSGNARTR